MGDSWSCLSCFEEPPQQPRKRINKDLIGVPTNFQHTGHIGSSDYGSSDLGAVQSQMHSKGGYGEDSSNLVTPGGIDIRNSQKPERKTKDTTMSKDERDSCLSLAYRELEELPRDCIPMLEHVQHLDLSSNKFSDLRSLQGLSGLTSLILDCNAVTSYTVFPNIPNLRILWLNKNQVKNLPLFVEQISSHFPRLRQLSMMNNPAAPSYFNGGSKQDYLDFRQFVISCLPRLEHLDDTMVTREERETAIRVYGRRRPGNVTGALDREKDMPNSRSKRGPTQATVAGSNGRSSQSRRQS